MRKPEKQTQNTLSTVEMKGIKNVWISVKHKIDQKDEGKNVCGLWQEWNDRSKWIHHSHYRYT